MLAFFSSLSAIIPIIFFLVFLRRNNRRVLWVIFFYVLLAFFADAIYHATHSRKVHFYVFSFFTVIEYSFFAIFFYLCLKSILVRRLIVAGSIIFLSIAFYNFSKDSDYSFDSITASIESTLVISYSVFFFYEQLKSLENTFIYSLKEFWVTIAILIYLSTTLFLFISSFYIPAEQMLSYWAINNAANIFKNILLSIAFALTSEKLKQPSFSRKFNT